MLKIFPFDSDEDYSTIVEINISHRQKCKFPIDSDEDYGTVVGTSVIDNSASFPLTRMKTMAQ